MEFCSYKFYKASPGQQPSAFSLKINLCFYVSACVHIFKHVSMHTFRHALYRLMVIHVMHVFRRVSMHTLRHALYRLVVIHMLCIYLGVYPCTHSGMHYTDLWLYACVCTFLHSQPYRHDNT